MKTFHIASSNGHITVNLETGDVTKIDPYDEVSPDKYFMAIKRFDIKEYEKFYKKKIKENESIDILDLGYWYRLKGEIKGHFWERGKDKYEEPAHDWRKEVAILRAGGEIGVFR